MCRRKYQDRYESNTKIPTHWSRWSAVYTVLLCSLAFFLIRYKGPRKQICWYYGFFQTLSSFLWVLCHRNRASHKWLVYEQILDQVLWHLPIKKVVCLFKKPKSMERKWKYRLLLWDHTRNSGITMCSWWTRKLPRGDRSLFMIIRKVQKIQRDYRNTGRTETTTVILALSN